jgi:NAD-dependent deacetylase sirtuin 5
MPNAAHHALATFCLPETLTRLSLDPKWPAPLLITQNMDALSSRVLSSYSPADKAAAEKCIIEMHGCIFETRCTSCAHVQRAYTPTPCASALGNADVGATVPIDQLPRCGGPDCTSNRYGRCGGLLRPGVVWFGEVPLRMGEIAQRMNWCDLLLLVGTSTTVSALNHRFVPKTDSVEGLSGGGLC